MNAFLALFAFVCWAGWGLTLRVSRRLIAELDTARAEVERLAALLPAEYVEAQPSAHGLPMPWQTPIVSGMGTGTLPAEHHGPPGLLPPGTVRWTPGMDAAAPTSPARAWLDRTLTEPVPYWADVAGIDPALA